MKHIDEFTLELFVLNSEKTAHRRAEIEEHLRACEGCRSLFGEISGFYGELDAELSKPPQPGHEQAVLAVMKRREDLPVWEERFAMGPWRGWSGPARKIRYYIRRYPLAAAGATFTFAATAVIGVMMGYGALTKDRDPAYVILSPANQSLEVYNAGNGLLWNRRVLDIDSDIAQQRMVGGEKYAVVDLDLDGRPEVLTTLNFQGMPVIPHRNLHVFDGDGNSRDFEFQRYVSFRETKYEKPLIIQSPMFRVDTAAPGAPEIYLTVTNDRSPSAILRMDNRGGVIGEYWHFGQIVSFYLLDLNGDGAKELVLCGFNDVNDNVGPSDPVIVVLDPTRLTGQGESSASRGFGYALSDAESYYIRLPLTELNEYTKKGAGMVRMVAEGDRLIFLWSTYDDLGKTVDLEFVFSATLEPQRVLSTTPIKESFDRLNSEKKIKTLLDGPYLDLLKSRIRFWDGREWKKGPTTIGRSPS